MLDLIDKWDQGQSLCIICILIVWNIRTDALSRNDSTGRIPTDISENYGAFSALNNYNFFVLSARDIAIKA